MTIQQIINNIKKLNIKDKILNFEINQKNVSMILISIFILIAIYKINRE